MLALSDLLLCIVFQYAFKEDVFFSGCPREKPCSLESLQKGEIMKVHTNSRTERKLVHHLANTFKHTSKSEYEKEEGPDYLEFEETGAPHCLCVSRRWVVTGTIFIMQTTSVPYKHLGNFRQKKTKRPKQFAHKKVTLYCLRD